MSISGPTAELSSHPLHTSGETLRAFLDAVPIAILAVDANERILAANPYALSMFGYAPGELDDQPLARLAPARSRQMRHPWLRRPAGPLLSRSAEEELRLKGLRRDGSTFPLEMGRSLVTLPQGAVHLLTLVDLSARKNVESRLLNLSLELAERSTELENRTAELQAQAEQRSRAEAELERSREDFRYLFQRNPLPMYLYNPQTALFLEVNEAACALYGYTREEMLSLHVTDIHPPDKLARVQEMLRAGNFQPFVKLRNWKHRSKDGRTIEVDTYSRSLGFGPQSARLVVVVDVTERNAAEAQLRQAQKMEAIGQITGGVAHDFNNLLTIILGNLELIAEQCAGMPAICAMTADALSSAQRGANLTQRLLAFSRQQPLEPRLINVEQLITEMAGLFRRSLGETIHIRQFLAPDLWRIRVDATQLENALLNLAVNARDAMPQGGDLTLEAQNVVVDEAYAREHPEATPGEYVQLAVSDTGTGIPPSVLEHILEPFFTTKPVGKGTGLGLSMVYGLVRQSGGHLEVESEVGRGTTIKLYLPRAYGEAAGTETETPSAMPRSERGETVLIVEDNETIRKLVRHLLTMLGYKVLAAEDATEALDLLESADHVDLLFTDFVLPNGMSGAALAAEAQLRHPALKLLYMSGYTRNALPQNPPHDESVPLLLKPFRKEELARAVHRALGHSS